MALLLLFWGVAVVTAISVWWCGRTGEISVTSLTVRRDEQPGLFKICLAMLVVLSLLIDGFAVKHTLAALS